MAAVKGPIKISEDLLKKEEFYHEKPLDLEKEVTADAKKYHIVLDENGKETDIYVFPKDHQLAGFAVEFYRNDKKSIGKEIVARVFKLFRCKHCYLRFVWKPSRDKHQNEIPHDKECQNGNGDNKCQMKFITEEERDDHQRNCSK